MQKTIKKNIMLFGIGVHSGKATAIVLRAASVDHGIVFYNAQFPDEPIHVGRIIPEKTMHATVVRQKSWVLSTTEHLLAALIMLGVDNVAIDVQGAEIPIGDGSALPFVQEILDCGFEDQIGAKKYLTPKKELIFNDDQGRKISVSSACNNDKNLYIDYESDFTHPLVGKNFFSACVTHDCFIQEIAPARTFGFLDQLPFMKKHGLAQGSSLGNTVVIGEHEFINDPRFPDECIRHKVLDLIGDLGLLGHALAGHVKASKTGHNFNRCVVEHFIQNPHDWDVI
ncbi:MAG: UDP-3-O-acyl-N-acetylglucosamine deacetylase [bacterium]